QRDKEKINLIVKIEQSDKEKTDLIAKLEYDVSLIKEQSLQDKDIVLISEEVPVSSEINSINNYKQIVLQSEDVLAFDISDNISNFDERVSNEIRQCNRESKLKCGSTIQDIFSDLSYIIETINDQDSKLLHNQIWSYSQTSEIDIQLLIQKLLLEYSEKDCIRIVNVEKGLVIDQSPAIKLYQYRKYFEKRLDDILSENQRNDKRANNLASRQIYDEMLQYLSEKIKQIKYNSANKLSKLTDMQINTIKKHFINTNISLHNQKSCTHMTEPVFTNSISKTEACEEAKKTLPETEISKETKEISIKSYAD
ncbi:5713_t:CDS:2, partial [Cetraspora pellucida]